MVKIRLSRCGSKKDPFYRVVATDESRKRGGQSLDILGVWHPKKNVIKIDHKKIDVWLKSGAQTTLAVNSLLKI
jgi:small subunit ribosomal protein S16